MNIFRAPLIPGSCSQLRHLGSGRGFRVVASCCFHLCRANANEVNGMLPKSWSGKGFYENVCNLEICTNIEKIELFTFKLLFQPFELDVLGLVHVSHGC